LGTELREFFAAKEYRDMSTTAISPQQSNIWWVFLLQGIMAIILGLLFLAAPGETLVAVVTFLGFYWLITGVLALVRVFVDRSVPWVWSLLIGIIGILAGIFVLRHPLLAALTVPTVLVIILGVQGLVMGVFDIIGGFKGGGFGDQHPGWAVAARVAVSSGIGGATRIRHTPAHPRGGPHYLGVSRLGLRSATPPLAPIAR
jgi:uncharacterized membrane protein HdeD (DUF308 family)